MNRREIVKACAGSALLASAAGSARPARKTDLREEMRSIRTRALIVQSDADASAPLPLTGAKSAKLLPNCELAPFTHTHGVVR